MISLRTSLKFQIVCICVYICVCAYVCMYVHMCVHVCMCVYMHTHAHMYMCDFEQHAEEGKEIGQLNFNTYFIYSPCLQHLYSLRT